MYPPIFFRRNKLESQTKNGSKDILRSVLAVLLCYLGKRENFQTMVANKISLGFLHQDSGVCGGFLDISVHF